jgi:transposase
LGLGCKHSANHGVCARVEVISGPERQRRWTDEEKRAIVAATLEPGAVIAEVARRAEVGTNQIYRWRRQISARSEWFAQVVMASAGGADLPPGDDSGCCAAPAIAVEFAGKAHLRIAASTPVALAVAVVKALAQL